MEPKSEMKERYHKTQFNYKGKAVGFTSHEVILPNGKKAVREYLVHPGATAVLPFINKDTVALVKQYRYPVKEITLEVPAGKIDPKESPLACVKRELKEETGFTAKKIIKLTTFWTTPAFADEVLHIYAAFGLSKATASPDEDEFISYQAVPFKKLLKLVHTGKVKDSKTIIAALYWQCFKSDFINFGFNGVKK